MKLLQTKRMMSWVALQDWSVSIRVCTATCSNCFCVLHFVSCPLLGPCCISNFCCALPVAWLGCAALYVVFAAWLCPCQWPSVLLDKDAWQLCLSNFIRPVLKHGLRSLMHVQAWGCLCLAESTSKLGTLHRQPIDHVREVWVWVCALGPERWWTMLGKNEVRGNPDGGSQRYWRANRSSYLGIGAKD